MDSMQTNDQQTKNCTRWMIRRDMRQVMAIEQASFAQPWTEEDFLLCLRPRNAIGMVHEPREPTNEDDAIQGYVVYELHKDRLHLLNLAVHPQYRRLDVGTAMIAKLVGKLSSHHRTRITVEVRESNLPALLFYKASGFTAGKVVRGAFKDTGEDGIRMTYRLPVDPDSTEAVDQEWIDLLNMDLSAVADLGN